MGFPGSRKSVFTEPHDIINYTGMSTAVSFTGEDGRAQLTLRAASREAAVHAVNTGKGIFTVNGAAINSTALETVIIY